LYRAIRMAGYEFGDTPQEKSIQALTTMRTEDNQIRAPFCGLVNDFGSMIAFSYFVCTLKPAVRSNCSARVTSSSPSLRSCFSDALSPSRLPNRNSEMRSRGSTICNTHTSACSGLICRITACVATSENLESSTASKIFKMRA